MKILRRLGGWSKISKLAKSAFKDQRYIRAHEASSKSLMGAFREKGRARHFGLFCESITEQS